jgi:hypothetical protein
MNSSPPDTAEIPIDTTACSPSTSPNLGPVTSLEALYTARHTRLGGVFTSPAGSNIQGIGPPSSFEIILELVLGTPRKNFENLKN